MVENFLKVYELCKTYGYNYFDEVENAVKHYLDKEEEC